MAMTGKRIEAKNLYVLKAKACTAIAEELGVDAGTVYRWKAEAKEKGEAQDWDYQRQLHTISPGVLSAKFRKALSIVVLQIEEEPALLLNPKLSDSLSKIVKEMEKIDARTQYLCAVTDLIKVANRWLAEHEPDLKTKLDPCWDGIFQEMSDYSTRKGLF
jgi:transposase-like protein